MTTMSGQRSTGISVVEVRFALEAARATTQRATATCHRAQRRLLSVLLTVASVVTVVDLHMLVAVR